MMIIIDDVCFLIGVKGVMKCKFMCVFGVWLEIIVIEGDVVEG